jgi:lambda repressor-like predicted transcriptional regulator
MDQKSEEYNRARRRLIIRAALRVRGWSLDTLAGEVGMSTSTLHRRLRGAIPWTLEEIGRIARMLDIEISKLI